MFLWETISPARIYSFLLMHLCQYLARYFVVPTFLLCGKHKIRYANTQIICISPKVIHFSCFSEDDFLYNIEGNYYSYTLFYVFLSGILRKKKNALIFHIFQIWGKFTLTISRSLHSPKDVGLVKEFSMSLRENSEHTQLKNM